LYAMRVSVVANAPVSPEMLVRGTVEIDGATLTWRTESQDLDTLRGFLNQLEAGFFISVDIDCNQLIGRNELPMSSSTSSLYGGPDRPLIPGGLLRLRVAVSTSRRPDIRFFRAPFRNSRRTPFLPGLAAPSVVTDRRRVPARPSRPTIELEG